MYFKQLMCGAMLMVASSLLAQNNVAEEVAWVVGDTPIWKSEIEEQFQNLRYDNKYGLTHLRPKSTLARQESRRR